MPKANIKKTLAYARELVLYGRDGKPVLDRKELAAETGTSLQTIDRHLNGWMQEREQLVASSFKQSFGIGLREEYASAHLHDVEFLRQNLDKIKSEMEAIDSSIRQFQTLVSKFDGGDKEAIDRALRAFEALTDGYLSKQKLRGQVVMIQNQLAKFNGVDNLTELAMQRAKLDQQLAAKVAAREAEAGGRMVSEVGDEVAGVFRRS